MAAVRRTSPPEINGPGRYYFSLISRKRALALSIRRWKDAAELIIVEPDTVARATHYRTDPLTLVHPSISPARRAPRPSSAHVS